MVMFQLAEKADESSLLATNTQADHVQGLFRVEGALQFHY